MWELDRQNDGFFQGFLGALQPSDVVPLDVGLLHHDGVVQLGLHLLLLWVVLVLRV